MWQVSLVTNWRDVLAAAAKTTSECSGTCAKVYFYVVRVTTGMIILPMFVGFVIESFNSTLPIVTSDYILSREKQHAELEVDRTVNYTVGADTDDDARDDAATSMGSVDSSGLPVAMRIHRFGHGGGGGGERAASARGVTAAGRGKRKKAGLSVEDTLRDNIAMFARSDELSFPYKSSQQASNDAAQRLSFLQSLKARFGRSSSRGGAGGGVGSAREVSAPLLVRGNSDYGSVGGDSVASDGHDRHASISRSDSARFMLRSKRSALDVHMSTFVNSKEFSDMSRASAYEREIAGLKAQLAQREDDLARFRAAAAEHGHTKLYGLESPTKQ